MAKRAITKRLGKCFGERFKSANMTQIEPEAFSGKYKMGFMGKMKISFRAFSHLVGLIVAKCHEKLEISSVEGWMMKRGWKSRERNSKMKLTC